MIISILLCAFAGIIFTLVDVYGYGDLVQGGKLKVFTYRVYQISLQFAIYAALFFTHHYGALVGFMVTHWCFGYDLLYYVIRGEGYEGYTITWFSISLPSLIFKAIGKPFMGSDLKWIGKVAIVIGLIIAAVFV